MIWGRREREKNQGKQSFWACNNCRNVVISLWELRKRARGLDMKVISVFWVNSKFPFVLYDQSHPALFSCSVWCHRTDCLSSGLQALSAAAPLPWLQFPLHRPLGFQPWVGASISWALVTLLLPFVSPAWWLQWLLWHVRNPQTALLFLVGFSALLWAV